MLGTKVCTCNNPEMKCYCGAVEEQDKNFDLSKTNHPHKKRIDQVGHNEMKKLPYIIAIDFDGTLVTDRFPEIGDKNERLFADAIRWREEGCKIILNTCRDDDTPDRHLSSAVAYCCGQGLQFDAVNRNIDECIDMFNNDTRKVYANVYIDDKALRPSFMEVFHKFDPRNDFKSWVPWEKGRVR